MSHLIKRILYSTWILCNFVYLADLNDNLFKVYYFKLSRRLNSTKYYRTSRGRTSELVSSLMKWTEIVLEPFVYSPINRLTRLLAPEYFTEHNLLLQSQ